MKKMIVAALDSGSVFIYHLLTEEGEIISSDRSSLIELMKKNGYEGNVLWSTSVDASALEGKVVATTDDVALVDGELVFLGQLRYVKQAAMATVDTRAASVIARGFTYKDHAFSLSIPAQMSLNGIFAVRETPGVFPLSWPTADNAEIITIADQKEFVDFFGAAFTAIRGARDEAAYLKALIQAADSEEAVAKEIAQ